MIRMATPSDAAAVAGIYRPVVERTVISFELDAPSAEVIAERIASTLSYAPWLVWAPAGRVVGYAYASRHGDRAAYQWSVNVSAYVHEDHRRSGIGRALYASLFRLLLRQGFYAAHAGITLPNPASVGLHEALGFRLVGVYPRVGFKLGAWHDVGWWQLPLRERAGEPVPPLSLAEAAARPGWDEALSPPRDPPGLA
jgi:phosphinothricin acetyltransferase